MLQRCLNFVFELMFRNRLSPQPAVVQMSGALERCPLEKSAILCICLCIICRDINVWLKCIILSNVYASLSKGENKTKKYYKQQIFVPEL